MDLDKFMSREAAVEFPIGMNVIGHLMRDMQIPRILHRGDGLAYHYTDAAGLMGIVATKRFWATNSAFLNDPTERSHALNTARERLATRQPRSNREGEFIHGALSVVAEKTDTDLYIVSFCRDGDLLSQWRAYGAFGAGYALGFEINTLMPHPQLGWLVEVLYDDDFLRSVVDEVFDIHAEHIEAHAPKHLEDFIDDANETLNLVAQGFKHPAYREEQELRLLFSRSNSADKVEDESRWYGLPISYRAKGGRIVSYLDTPLDFPNQADFKSRLPLKKIVIGPGASFSQSERALRGFLTANGFASVDIVPSTIPFRL